MVGRGLDSTDLSVQLPGAWSAASGGRWAHKAPTGLAHTQCHRSPYSIALGGGLRSWKSAFADGNGLDI